LQAQTPVMHIFPSGEHANPQPPQLKMSVFILTQTLEQHFNPDGHDSCSLHFSISSSSKISPLLSTSISYWLKSFY